MREHPLVPMIRLALLCLCACLLMPELGLFIPAFLFPSCTCCGGCGGACSATAPSSFTVTVSGVPSDTTPCGGVLNCTTINRAFVVTSFLSDATSCTYDINGLSGMCVNHDHFQLKITYNATHTQIIFYSVSASGGVNWGDTTTLAASPIDCSSIGSIALPYLSRDSGTLCDGTGSTATVTN